MPLWGPRCALSPREIVAAAREIIREPRLLPYLVLPERVEDIPCVMPEGYHRPRGCGAKSGEACRKGEPEACLQRRECFRYVGHIYTRPDMPFHCPACRAVPGQYCIRIVYPEVFEPAHDHTHPSRRRLGDAVRAAMGGPPIREQKAYAEWVRGDRRRAAWARALGEAYYILHYEAGTEAERARARRIVDRHEALPARPMPEAPSARKVAPAPSTGAPVAVAQEAPPKGPRFHQVTFE